MAFGHERGATSRRPSRRRFLVLSAGAPMAQPLSRNDYPAANRPRRLSITMPANVFAALERRSTLEGRSLSNLAAYLLEASLAAGVLRAERH